MLLRAACVAICLVVAGGALATAHAAGGATDQRTVILPGNTRPEARAANDLGALPYNYRVDDIQLLLKPDAATAAARQRFLRGLYDEASPHFHQWITARQFGERFGPSQAAIDEVVAWLQSHGFTVNGVSRGRLIIDFSGTAGDVKAAFQTEMHRLKVNGQMHIANMSDPRIPAALSYVVDGILSLNDFRPHTYLAPAPDYTAVVKGRKLELVAPGDLATIYNLKPLFAAGTTGAGETIAVMEDSDTNGLDDWKAFRSRFGLDFYTTGSWTEIHPSGAAKCRNPGQGQSEGEATLDAQWSSAAAPGAAIINAACADHGVTNGVLFALENVIDGDTPPNVVSVSYGECEADNGAKNNAAFSAIYQQAAMIGISVYVSAGDEGADRCDGHQNGATNGITVNGFASTPFNMAIGGTDFADTYEGKTDVYWTEQNSADFVSAKSYIPEIPWNDTCGSVLLAASNGFSQTYGSSGFCNSTAGRNYLADSAGGGGPSACATGKPHIASVTSGTCKGYPKPYWQSVFGNPEDGVRDIPDVSLFAANGVWQHAYVYCNTGGGGSCSGPPKTWSRAGGTSFAAPIMAGIQALIDQYKGANQGLPNPVFYKLAARQYGKAGNPDCASTKGANVGATCIFHDLTLGDNDIACTGTYNCYLPSGTYGVLSRTDTDYEPAFTATPGWDFTSGIGTINAENLVKKW